MLLFYVHSYSIILAMALKMTFYILATCTYVHITEYVLSLFYVQRWIKISSRYVATHFLLH